VHSRRDFSKLSRDETGLISAFQPSEDEHIVM
jgi:hypothetical protein